MTWQWHLAGIVLFITGWLTLFTPLNDLGWQAVTFCSVIFVCLTALVIDGNRE